LVDPICLKRPSVKIPWKGGEISQRPPRAKASFKLRMGNANPLHCALTQGKCHPVHFRWDKKNNELPGGSLTMGKRRLRQEGDEAKTIKWG